MTFERHPIRPRDLTTPEGLEALEAATVMAGMLAKLAAVEALVDEWEAQVEWMDEPQSGVLRLCAAEVRAIIGAIT